jgi:hypothetical protein
VFFDEHYAYEAKIKSAEIYGMNKQ